ncbi:MULTISPECIES: DUF2490 domain-containing protein [Niastella]|uniref:DUF2490 domain-containing protein n=1 Tax=Niastella soli TaxID=2821487 RepID=A0ABS3YMK5_9BACT|nr:DUF2490 domain-containing protein [Niastella soli]MBO9199129.1 DUF2490 domain-containing protein [Niastella soli]
MSFYKQLTWMMVGMIAGYNTRSQVALSGWATTNNQFSISRKVTYHLEASFRSDPKRQYLQTFLMRTGAFVQLNSRWSVGGGYCLNDNRRTIGGITAYATEHQALEQAWLAHPVYFGGEGHRHKTFMRHRLRLENRWLPNLQTENDDLKKTGTSFTNRLRYQIREQIPLVSVINDFNKGTYVLVQNELFFNVSGQQFVNGKWFDQNRSLVGTGYRFNRHTDLELSYMLRVIKDAGNGWGHENLLQVTAFSRL